MRVHDALQVVLGTCEAEGKALTSYPGANQKLLPPSLKWCASNILVLGSLLQPSPAVPSGAARPAHAILGRGRLLVIELFLLLINLRRPPLTAALALCQPPVISAALRLLTAHPSSGILAAATLHLLRAAIQVMPNKFRLATLVGTQPGESVQQLVVAALASETAAALAAALPGAPPLSPQLSSQLSSARPAWIEMAGLLDATVAADKQLKPIFAADPNWCQLASALPALRALYLEGTLSDPPPPRPAMGGEMGGEMGELLAMLRRMPQG